MNLARGAATFCALEGTDNYGVVGGLGDTLTANIGHRAVSKFKQGPSFVHCELACYCCCSFFGRITLKTGQRAPKLAHIRDVNIHKVNYGPGT